MTPSFGVENGQTNLLVELRTILASLFHIDKIETCTNFVKDMNREIQDSTTSRLNPHRLIIP
jgi:hypothetical protein